MKRTRNLLFTVIPLQLIIVGFITTLSFSAEGKPNATSEVDVIKAQAEKTKADAEMTKAEAEKMKAQAELTKSAVEVKKAATAGTQFYLDWSFRLGLAVVGVLLLVWLIPQISEISLPWGGGTFSLKRAPKEPLLTGSEVPHLAAPGLTEATEVIKKTLTPGPAKDKIVDRLEETEIYRMVGIAKDAIYVCHHSKKIPRSNYYQIRIYLDAETDDILDKVEKVIYRLHSTFRQNEITQTNRREQFQAEISAWGEFMLYAFAYFKGQQKPIELKRYLNF